MLQLQLFDDCGGWPSTYILVSLMPQYAYALVRGEKRYEYRRGQFVEEPVTAFVYATTPKSKADQGLPNSQLVAVAKLGNPVVGLKRVIDLKEKEEAGSTQMMLNWLEGFTTASAHPIEEVHAFSRTLTLAEIRCKFPEFQPPQRYLILNRNRKLLEYLMKESGAFDQ